MLNLEPQKVFEFFSEISAIPRGSGNEKAASDYVMAFARGKGFEASQDAAKNAVVYKPGTAGYEKAPRVILQGHLDMVCEKNRDVVHDFMKDGIKLVYDPDSGFIRGSGTTLGGDNGIAVAMVLAVLDGADIPHPPLTAIFTTQEETGMHGAAALDPKHLAAGRMINLDSAKDGIFTAGCAGGLRTRLTVSGDITDAPAGMKGLDITVSGLKGGHSGSDINKERGNANKLLGRVLTAFLQGFDIRLVRINGGEKENAIPRDASAKVLVNSADADDAISLGMKLAADIKNEYSHSDPAVSITIRESGVENRAFSKETTERVVITLSLLPSGVQHMEQALPGFVETSLSLGVVRTIDNGVTFHSSLRSSVASRKYAMLSQIKNAAAILGATLETNGDYPAWAYKKESALRDICAKAYLDLFGEAAEVSATHGGLECGILLEKAKGVGRELDIVAFGPDIFDNHSPDERMSVPSVARTWELLKEVLKRLNA